MNLAYKLTMNTYNKKRLSINTKLRHYQTVIRPEALYAAECLNLTNMGMIKKLELVERKILRKILGPQKTEDGSYRRKGNSELYLKVEKISDTIRKRRAMFFGHISRMEPERLTNQIVRFFESKKTTVPWFQEVKKDLEEMGIQKIEVDDRNTYRSKIKNTKSFQLKTRPRNQKPWTDERRREQSERMSEYWAKIKTQKLKSN